MANLTARKMVKRGDKAHDALLKGAEAVYEAVAATLGPRSENVALERPWGAPAVVHDGVTVAREVLPLVDAFENIGAELLVQAAERTGAVGDGTTTATVLTHAIHKAAHTYRTAGMPIMGIREGIEAAVAVVSQRILDNAVAVEGTERLKQVARVSAQLEDIGEMVVSAVEAVGADGVVTVEESSSTDTFVEVKQGLEFAKGFRSPHFITDPETGEAEVENAHILITDHKLTSMQDFMPAMEAIVNQSQIKNLVVIADDIDAEVLATFIVNKIKGRLSILAIQAPEMGQKRLDVLQDIAIVTGGTVISQEQGMDFGSPEKPFDVSQLGKATRVKSSISSTIIVGGAGAEEDVTARATEIKAKAENPDTGDFDREKLLERHAKLTTGIAVVHVGARTESELKERKERTIDAISAVKAAIAEGIVPGGGTALIKASAALDELEATDPAVLAGIDIVRKACRAPYDRLLKNSGFDPGEYFEKVSGPDNNGLDVVSGKVGNLIEAGIIDPAKVVRSALENAGSAGVMLATTSVIVVEERKADQEQHVTAH